MFLPYLYIYIYVYIYIYAAPNEDGTTVLAQKALLSDAVLKPKGPSPPKAPLPSAQRAGLGCCQRPTGPSLDVSQSLGDMGCGLKLQGLGFRVLGFRVWGLGFL